jgi:hypothetical protein
LTAVGSTSKGTGSISCEVEFCIFYRLSLRTLRTKDVVRWYGRLISVQDVKIPTRLCYVVHTCRNLLDLRSLHGYQL